MSLDRDALAQAVQINGRVARVVIVGKKGSAPREPGASMMVWDGGQQGTIGGGALEFEATRRAESWNAGVASYPLGPSLGQCCGGAVMLVTEIFDQAKLREVPLEGIYLRPLGDTPSGPAPAASLCKISGERKSPQATPRLIDGWLAENICHPLHQVWIWGAGHVGRALAKVMAPLPGVALTWIDTSPGRFPDRIAKGITVVPARNPVDMARHAPEAAEHLVVTFSHQLDLELCNALLGRGFAELGLIGSATKWARFRQRLSRLGHGDDSLARITCPIGDPTLGKQPHAIALSVAHDMLQRWATTRNGGGA